MPQVLLIRGTWNVLIIWTSLWVWFLFVNNTIISVYGGFVGESSWIFITRTIALFGNKVLKIICAAITGKWKVRNWIGLNNYNEFIFPLFLVPSWSRLSRQHHSKGPPVSIHKRVSKDLRIYLQFLGTILSDAYCQSGGGDPKNAQRFGVIAVLTTTYYFNTKPCIILSSSNNIWSHVHFGQS